MAANGFLNLQSDRLDAVSNEISLVVKSLMLITQCTIGIIAVYKMLQRSQEQKVGSQIQTLFICSWLCASICTTIGIIRVGTYFIIWSSYDKIIQCFYTTAIGLFFMSLLATLAWRLHVTFNQSVYRMSPRIQYTFVISLILLLIGIIGISLSVFFYDTLLQWKRALIYSSSVWLILYFCSSGLAVYVFACNLSKLAKSRSPSIGSIGSHPKDIQLTKQQQDLSDLAARYIMLFLIAVVSTVLMQLLSYAVPLSALRTAFYDVDLSINMLTIYLQFAFARNHYLRCCGCCDARFKRIITKQNQRIILQQSLELQQSASPSPTTPSAFSYSSSEHASPPQIENVNSHSEMI